VYSKRAYFHLDLLQVGFGFRIDKLLTKLLDKKFLQHAAPSSTVLQAAGLMAAR